MCWLSLQFIIQCDDCFKFGAQFGNIVNPCFKMLSNICVSNFIVLIITYNNQCLIKFNKMNPQICIQQFLVCCEIVFSSKSTCDIKKSYITLFSFWETWFLNGLCLWTQKMCLDWLCNKLKYNLCIYLIDAFFH